MERRQTTLIRDALTHRAAEHASSFCIGSCKAIRIPAGFNAKGRGPALVMMAVPFRLELLFKTHALRESDAVPSAPQTTSSEPRRHEASRLMIKIAHVDLLCLSPEAQVAVRAKRILQTAGKKASVDGCQVEIHIKTSKCQLPSYIPKRSNPSRHFRANFKPGTPNSSLSSHWHSSCASSRSKKAQGHFQLFSNRTRHCHSRAAAPTGTAYHREAGRRTTPFA